jgi:hypothetical protein
MSTLALLFAGMISIAAGLIHSWLGERKLLGPVLASMAEGSVARRVLRFAWHLTSLAWAAVGAILVALALSPPDRLGFSVLLIVTVLLWLNGLVSFLAGGVRHIGWPLFCAAAAAATLVLFGLWPVSGSA